MYTNLLAKKAKLAVIGLGYVGLPIALAFAKKLSVIGFDINEERLDLMRQGLDPSKELDASAFENADILFTSSVEVLKEAGFCIVAVPHKDYLLLGDDYFCSITKPTALIADLKGIYRNKILNRKYYSL